MGLEIVVSKLPVKILVLFSFVVFICTVHAQYRFNCAENHCSIPGNECPSEFNCSNGRTVHNATKCGCCPICIKNLKENEKCYTELYGWDRRMAECGPGLVCNATSSEPTCVPTECVERLKHYKKEYSSSKSQLKVTFECDHFGLFEPSVEEPSKKPHVVCIDDVLCFCVDKNGKRIFGTDFASKNKSKSNMNCNCSRDVNDFPKKVDAKNLPRCLSNGDYDPLQCVQDICFCMKSYRGRRDEVAKRTQIKRLSCYNEKRHTNNRLTECLRKREQQINQIKKQNLTDIGLNRIQCELDGTYSPLQCQGERCYCVKTNGEKHNGYDNLTKENRELTCRCLRDKELIKSLSQKDKTRSMKTFESINCRNYIDSAILGKFVSDFMTK